MSSNKNGLIGYVKETVEGVTPTNPEIKILQVIPEGTTINNEPITIESELRTSGRRANGSEQVGLNVSSNIESELKFGSHKEFIGAVLCNDWVEQNRSAITTISGIDIIVTDNTGFAVDDVVGCKGSKAVITAVDVDGVTITVDTALANAEVDLDLVKVGVQADASDVNTLADGIDSTLLDYTSLGLANGVHIKLSGFATEANNNYVRVRNIATNKLTLDNLPTGWNAGETGTIQILWGDYVIDGDIRKSYTLHQKIDTNPISYEYSSGHSLNTMNLALDTASKINTTFTTIGKTAEEFVTSKKSGQTEVALYNSNIMNTSSNIGRLFINGLELGGTNYVSSMNIEVNNNIEGKGAIGYYYNVQTSFGDMAITGNITMLLNDISIVNAIRNGTIFGVLSVFARNGQAQIFDVPAIKLNSETIGNDGNDVTISSDYSALPHEYMQHMAVFQEIEAY
ncbi:hypothetical protein IB642_04310 [Allofrancisella guangzhouensis]|uniref:Tail protein n=1 Tax=Allofrancisella guangzhouensis TaxID=594679 RepID=A0A0A8E3X5_9GAMM|nr:phage tail tube protein [Allofrancisella guangzhouensis]AJC48693.1 hypothetical protein SD28_03065 [Allofrancisella guangzhouensis]MBK2026961.1 hypothetical protein [Allofrancisella guangzhouensis]MBK2044242.1 hypothetical protein [Allofrancisella guangzhouensis]MBK2045151.1 hypothetical protein [Allofrancisella guangzhouensis]